MTSPLPDDLQDPFASRIKEGTAANAHHDYWVVVLEFAGADSEEPLSMVDVRAILEYLSEWHSSGLWSPDRYAIQLHVPARTPHQALERAADYNRNAFHATGLPPARLLRAEVSTVEEFERGWQDHVAPPSLEGAVCRDLYTATRRLLVASTPDELNDIVIDFATAVGGRVEPGTPRHLPGTIDVDLSIDGAERCHVSAEAFSVAGLIIEHSLAPLLQDARLFSQRFPLPLENSALPAPQSSPNGQ